MRIGARIQGSRFRNQVAVAICVIASWAICAGQMAGQEPPRVRVGSKASIENTVLGEVVTQLARYAGAKAEHRSALGGTQIVFQALVKGDIDVYPEYTGTLTAEILQDEQLRTDEQLRAALARRGLEMSQTLGFNNPYVIGLKESLAERLGVKTISDLARPEHARLRMGFSDEFMHRGDGWPGLQATYGLTHQPKTMDHNLAYRGIQSDSLDVTDLYATDAEVKSYNLRVLEDDRGYFPSYHCALLFRSDLQARAPAVVAAFRQLEGQIDNEAMIAMNCRSKLDHVRDAQIATDFLNDQLSLSVATPKEPSGLLTKTRQHLFLVVVSLSAAVLVSVPLGIWSYKWPKLGQAIMGVVGIIQTLPSMAVLVFMIPLLGIGPGPAIVALFLYSLLPIVRGTLTGLKEIPNNLKESAIVLGLSPRARLWRVELPMASRSILSGIKTAAVINVGTATIGALIGAGGYGDLILAGLRLADVGLILQGAVPAAVLALLVQAGFDFVERLVVPQGLRLATGKS
jgi:osmoprotectant transport system permease protein